MTKEFDGRDRGGGGAVRADGAGSAAQVGFLHRRVRQQVRRVVGQRHSSRLEHVAAVRDARAPGSRSARRAGSSCPSRLISTMVRKMSAHQQRREAERRLVEQQQAAAATSARGRSPASAARRPRACRRAASRARARRGNSAIHVLACRRRPARSSAAVGAQLEVLLDRQVGEDGAPLGRVRDARATTTSCGGMRDRSRPSNVIVAAARPHQARDRAQRASTCRRRWRRSA